MTLSLALVDDDSHFADWLRAALPPHEVLQQSTWASEQAVDLVLWNMDAHPRPLEGLLASAGDAGVVLLWNEAAPPEVVMAALRAGAVEAIAKAEADRPALLAAVQRHLRRREEAARPAGDAAGHFGELDSATGLYKQTVFLKHLNAEFDRARRYRRRFSLIAMATDPVSASGEQARMTDGWMRPHVSAMLSQALRVSDVVAVSEDGYFLMILPETPLAGAQCVADRLREALRDLELPGEGERVGLTACFGLAAFGPGDHAPRHLLKRTEAAMREAQRQGTDQVCLAEGEGLDDAVTEEPGAWALRKQVQATVVAPGASPVDPKMLTASFLSSASQELHSPLSAMIGYAELLSDGLAGPLNPEQLEHLAQLEAQARRLRSQLETMLVVARHEAVPATLSLQPVALSELCSEVVGALAPVARGANVLLAVTRDGGASTALLDPRWIRQALSLLIEHAIKLTPEQERVEVRTYRLGDESRIEVTAPLGGLPAPTLDQLFGKRQGLLPQLLGMKNGFGFSIQFARTIVEAHGGSIGYDCGSGRQDTLWIALPPAAPVLAAAPAPSLAGVE